MAVKITLAQTNATQTFIYMRVVTLNEPQSVAQPLWEWASHMPNTALSALLGAHLLFVHSGKSKDVLEETLFSFMMVSRPSAPPITGKNSVFVVLEKSPGSDFFSRHMKSVWSAWIRVMDLKPPCVSATDGLTRRQRGQIADVLDYNKHMNAWPNSTILCVSEFPSGRGQDVWGVLHWVWALPPGSRQVRDTPTSTTCDGFSSQQQTSDLPL